MRGRLHPKVIVWNQTHGLRPPQNHPLFPPPLCSMPPLDLASPSSNSLVHTNKLTITTLATTSKSSTCVVCVFFMFVCSLDVDVCLCIYTLLVCVFWVGLGPGWLWWPKVVWNYTLFPLLFVLLVFFTPSQAYTSYASSPHTHMLVNMISMGPVALLHHIVIHTFPPCYDIPTSIELPWVCSHVIGGIMLQPLPISTITTNIFDHIP